MLNDVYLLEDHNEALKIWREKNVHSVDLIHIDAHIDFGFHQVKPIGEILNRAKSVKELKGELEKHIAFNWYESDLDKQTNIGNYIYPAIQEGIVKDFYWVIPGGINEFNKSRKLIRNIHRALRARRCTQKEGVISAHLAGRKFIVCILEELPNLRQKVLLDIDTDFLVIDSLINANNTARIGQRKPWIMPKELAGILKDKVKEAEVITVAYSVNGGYTPMRYKHLGDEIAYHFAPAQFKGHLKRALGSAKYFNLFSAGGGKEYYQKAVRLNPRYRAADNNYGPLYLSLRKFALAEGEFLKILRVDPKNPGCLVGLGNIALAGKDFKKAKEYFIFALKCRGNNGLFAKEKSQGLLGLANAEFALGNFQRAKKLLFRCKSIMSLQAQVYYLLARIYEKEKDFLQAADFYQDAIRLGSSGIEPIWRLLKISRYLKEKYAIINYIIPRYKNFKAGFLRAKGKIRGLSKVMEKMKSIEIILEGGEQECRRQ